MKLVMGISSNGSYSDTLISEGTYSVLAEMGQEIANFYQNKAGFDPIQVLKYTQTLFRESDGTQIELFIE